MDSIGSRSARTREALLAHHIRTGRIIRVKRGLYVSVPYGSDSDKFQIDPFLLAGKMTDDAVLAYHTAFQFYGKAHSSQERFLFLTTKAVRPANFRGYEFRGLGFPKSLVRLNQEFFAVETAERLGLSLRVTSLERTLVDVLDRPLLGGGWEEIWRSLESVEYLDLDKVVDYSAILGNSSTIAKLGYFLEMRRDILFVGDTHLEHLRRNIPKQPTYMEKNTVGRLVKKWNLMVPLKVYEQTWNEIY